MTETPNAPQKSTRDRIAAELVRIVSRNGTAGASVRRITKAAGCNESVLYDHFENKAVMQKTVFDEIADPADDEMRAHLETTGVNFKLLVMERRRHTADGGAGCWPPATRLRVCRDSCWRSWRP